MIFKIKTLLKLFKKKFNIFKAFSAFICVNLRPKLV